MNDIVRRYPMFRRPAAIATRRVNSIVAKWQDKFAVKLIVRTVQEMIADDATHMAAAVSYYGMLSLFPLTLGLITVLSFFLEDASTRANIIAWVSDFLPGSDEFIGDNINDVLDARGTIGFFAIIGLFWSGSAVFGGITRSINRAWDINIDRPIYISKARQLGMAILTSLLFLCSVAITTFMNLYERFAQFDMLYLDTLLNTASIIILHASSFLLVLAVFLMLYKYVPNTKTYWRYVWVGAVVAAILFEITQNAFIIYLSNFASFENIYGRTLAPVMALLLWAYLSGLILILGAELSSEYGRLKRGIERGNLLH